MKVILHRSSVLFTVFMLLFVTACGKQSSPEKAGEAANSQEKVELRWSMWAGTEEERAVWEKLADRVTEKYPNISVVFESASYPEYWPKLQTQLASGTAPDIISLHAEKSASFAQNHVFEPLDPYIQKTPDLDIADFEEAGLEALTIKDQKLALPYDTGVYVMYYNKDLFDKYGVEYPKEGMTWDQFLEKAKALTRDGNYGFSFGTTIEMMATWIYSSGGDIYSKDETKPMMSDPKTVESLQFLQDLIYKHKVVTPFTDPGNWNFYQEQFRAGKVAMILDGPWSFANVRSKAGFDWDISPIPVGPAGPVVYSTASGFGINSASKHKEEAWKAISVILDKEGQKILAEGGRGYPARKSALQPFMEADPKPANISALTKAASAARPYAKLTNWQEVRQTINQEMDKIWYNNAPVGEVTQNLDSMLDGLLQEHRSNSE